jgi:putative transferase (TIGR04331 family)
LGAAFRAINSLTGVESTWFFSHRDFKENPLNSEVEGTQKSYLSLGASVAEWQIKTAELTGSIYRELIEDSREVFSTGSSEPASYREVEVLAGSLALSISQRLARSEQQIKILDDVYSFNDRTIEKSSTFNLETPKNISESCRLLASEEMSYLIDSLAVRRHFRLASKVLATNLSSDSVLQSDKSDGSQSLMYRGYLKIQKCLSESSSKNAISISASYLGRIQEIFLSLILGQTPSFLEVRPPLESGYYFPVKRTVLLESESIRATALFLMKILAPSSLVEGYSATLKRSYSLGFAKNPSVIFTSNSFDTDDEFKVHLVEALPSAVYVVGQHGNNFGISKTTEICPEQNASDLFLSWGWGAKSDGVHPFGQIQSAVKGKFPSKVRGVTLLLRDEYDSLLQADMHEINHRYFMSIEQICASLNDLQVTTHLRLHTSTSSSTKNFLEKAVEKMPFVKISGDRPSIRKLLASGMGIVFGYDSTGMLEMGTAGIPFFLFAPDGLGLVRQEFQTNYDSLRSAGLLSEDPAQAAQLISEWITAPRETRSMHTESLRHFTAGIAHYPKNKLWRLRKVLKGLELSRLKK